MFVHDLNEQTIPFENFAYLRLGDMSPVSGLKVANPLDGFSFHSATFLTDRPPRFSSHRSISIPGSLVLSSGEVLPAQFDAEAKPHRLANILRRLALKEPIFPSVYVHMDVAWQDGVEPVGQHIHTY